MNAPRSNRRQTTEAVLFFRGDKIGTEMMYPEFEAVLDDIVSLPELAGKHTRAAYVVINSRLQVRKAVLFYLGFDEQGVADPSWNIPLRQLAEKATSGPDLGDGPLRLVCRSQSPAPWLQAQLWDPDLSPGNNHLVAIRDAVRRNNLRLLVEEEEVVAATVETTEQAVRAAPTEDWLQNRALVQVEAEEKAARQALEQQELERQQKHEREQRIRAARLIKQQRLRIRMLETEYAEALARIRQHNGEKLDRIQQSLDEAHQELREQIERNQLLAGQVEQLTSIGEAARLRIQDMALQEQAQVASLKAGFEQELQAHKAVLETAQTQQQQKLQKEFEERLVELEATLQKAVAENESCRQEYVEMMETSGSLLQQLEEAEVSLVTMQPGAGHITIPVDEVSEFLRSPAAYAAKYCMVSEEEYLTWLKHYELPVCDAVIPVTGEPCGLPLERKTHPGRFTQGISNRCSRHRELC